MRQWPRGYERSEDYGGRTPTWWELALYAIAVILLFGLVMWLQG